MMKLAALLPVLALALALPASAAVKGTYHVPVTDPSLLPFATIPVDVSPSEVVTGPYRISFPLPLELVGKPYLVELAAMPDGTWSGKDVTANCQVSDSNVACAVAFGRMDVDFAGVARRLGDLGITGAEFDGRIGVAAAFSGEPIGVFEYQLR